MVANVIVMPLLGFLTQTFGRRKFYTFSVLLFTLTSGLCGISQSYTQIIVFRTLQGFGGGLLTPLAQATLMEVFPAQEGGWPWVSSGSEPWRVRQ